MVDETPTTPKDAATKPILSEGDNKFLIGMMKHLIGEISIPFDAAAMAKEFNYKDAGIVKTRWGQIKKKLTDAGAGASPAGIKKRTPKKSMAKKDKAVDSAVEEDDASSPTTSAKSPKKRGRKPKAVEKAEPESTGDAIIVKKEGNGSDEGEATMDEDE